MPRASRNEASSGDEQANGESTSGSSASLADLPEIGAQIGRWRDDFFDEVRRRPTRSLLLAVGAGYLAGGGIGTVLTARLLGLGARIAMRLAVIPLLADGIERALFDARPAGPTEANAKTPNPKQLSHQKETAP